MKSVSKPGPINGYKYDQRFRSKMLRSKLFVNYSQLTDIDLTAVDFDYKIRVPGLHYAAAANLTTITIDKYDLVPSLNKPDITATHLYLIAVTLPYQPLV